MAGMLPARLASLDARVDDVRKMTTVFDCNVNGIIAMDFHANLKQYFPQ
jgi:hypothetical protein